MDSFVINDPEVLKWMLKAKKHEADKYKLEDRRDKLTERIDKHDTKSEYYELRFWEEVQKTYLITDLDNTEFDDETNEVQILNEYEALEAEDDEDEEE
jgi:phage-related protein